MYQYVLFDLDGTLTDSAEGIVNSVVHALNKRGLPVPEQETLLKFVGPPLLDSFQRYCGMTREEGMQGITDYREYFTDRGWCENLVYEGIPELLQKLKAAGKTLIVATSKPEVFAKRIVEHFGLAEYFTLVVGSTLDEKRTGKGQVIDLVIRTIGEERCGEMVMVGDREHDVRGAKENGLPCIGVLYGYGSREELEQAGAAQICESVQELENYLLG